MLNGIDISNWQNMQQLECEIEDGCDFVIIKASEGCTFVDPKAKDFALKCSEHGIPIFFYHYCQLTRTPEEEAEHFMKCVNHVLTELPKGTRVGLVLDFEIKVSYIPELVKMIVYLNSNYHVNPIIYCSEWLVGRIGTYLDVSRYGLWVAKYSHEPPDIEPWDVMAFWQYTSEPIDRNRFYGDKEQLEKYQDYCLPSQEKCPWCTRHICIKE